MLSYMYVHSNEMGFMYKSFYGICIRTQTIIQLIQQVQPSIVVPGQFRGDGHTVFKLCWSLLQNAKHIEFIDSAK